MLRKRSMKFARVRAFRLEANNRTGVAANRIYKRWKQCEVYDSFDGPKGTGSQDTTTECSRTYKMNSHLRHNNPNGLARVTSVKRSSEFVYIGDGVSMDRGGAGLTRNPNMAYLWSVLGRLYR